MSGRNRRSAAVCRNQAIRSKPEPLSGIDFLADCDKMTPRSRQSERKRAHKRRNRTGEDITMKHATWAIAACLIAGGMMAQPAHAQQYVMPSGSIAPTMAANEPASHYSPWIKDPSPEQVRAAWGLDNPDKSHANSWIHDPTPAQVEAAWGKPGDPQKSDYNPWRKPNQ
jgi:hypothetical protein